MLAPRTTLGEAMDVIIDYLSIVIMTLPIAIIGRTFHVQYENYFKYVLLSPSCG
jgi:hypothetical protein